MDTKDVLISMSTRDILIALDIYHKHDWEKVYNTIAKKETSMIKDSNILLKVEIRKYKLLYKGYKFVTLVDEEYPKSISKEFQPPFVIYYKCNNEDLENKYFEKYTVFDNNIKRLHYGCFLD